MILSPELTEEQKRFIIHHKIPPAAVLDASGMRRSEYQAELKRQGKAVALVETTCRRGHTTRLRLSSGHCMECSPQGIAHWKRHHGPAFIYIAESRALSLFKIGLSKVASERADSLNRDGYGGATDWRILYRRKFDVAGWVEAQAQTSLRVFEQRRKYTRLGHGTETEAGELFSCTYDDARTALERLAEFAMGAPWER